jgi:flagellar basal-body rod protein FlgF
VTRDGQFAINQYGQLVTKFGDFVLGEDGPIVLNTKNFVVDEKGNISIENQVVSSLEIVFADDGVSLSADKNGLYRINGAFSKAINYRVHQGVVEQSNVNVSDDMVRMIETTRHIEAVQRALAAYNEIISTGINQLGKE